MSVKAQKLSDNLFIVMTELSKRDVHYAICPKEVIDNCEEVVFVNDIDPSAQ